MTEGGRSGRDGSPRTVVVAGEGFARVDGAREIGVRPTETGGVPEAHVAVHRPTGVAAWGANRDEAIERVRNDEERYDAAERSGAIVETDGVLGGDPRVDGSRIGVLHVVDRYDATGSLVETAAGFVGLLTVDEVRAALAWADDHPEVVQRLRDERARFRERVRSDWERLGLGGESDATVYRRPDSGSTFAILDPDEPSEDGEADE